MYEMRLHDIGEGMTEGEVVQLLVQVGDSVSVDQPVMEVLTDKVSAELPAPVGGRIAKIFVDVGDVISVGTTMLIIEEASEEASNDTSNVTQLQPSSHLEQTLLSRENSPVKFNRVKAAPYTRRLAREYGIDIEAVEGTGINGRVTVEDLERIREQAWTEGTYEEVAISAMDTSVTGESIRDKNSSDKPMTEMYAGDLFDSRDNVLNRQGAVEKRAASPALKKGIIGTTAKEEGAVSNVIPFTGRRKQIANKMIQSMYTIPHVTHFDKIDMTQLLEFKEQYQQELAEQFSWLDREERQQERLSIISFIMKALTMALKEYPIFNAKLDEKQGEIRIEPHVNLGIAVNTEEGLIVPVLQKAEELSIYELNRQMKDLTRRAQQNQLLASELRGGTITISNVGPIGGMFATPIINHPEVALLAFHQLEDMPVVRRKEIVIRSMLNFSMSFDHRVADGVTAVQFTNRMKEMLESPLQLFTRLI